MAKPVLISLRFEDDEGGQGAMAIYCDSADVNTVAEATTIANTMIPLIFGDDGVSGCGVLSAEVSFPLDLTAAEAVAPSAFTPANNSRKDAGATLSFRNVNTRAWPFYIPAIDGDFISGGKVVVTTGNNMEGLIDTMIAGITGLKITDENGLDLVSYRDGNQSVRKS